MRCPSLSDTAEQTLFYCSQWDGPRRTSVLSPVDILNIFYGPVFKGLPAYSAEMTNILWGIEQMFLLFYLMVEKIMAAKEE